MKKALWLILGLASLGLGAVGAVLPVLPSFPFLLLAAFSFARSSDKMHAWFTGTALYKNNLESYVRGQGMTSKTKARIMVTVTALMAFGFVMMLRRGLYIPCGTLATVWLAHLIYFIFIVKSCEVTGSGR